MTWRNLFPTYFRTSIWPLQSLHSTPVRNAGVRLRRLVAKSRSSQTLPSLCQRMISRGFQGNSWRPSRRSFTLVWCLRPFFCRIPHRLLCCPLRSSRRHLRQTPHVRGPPGFPVLHHRQPHLPDHLASCLLSPCLRDLVLLGLLTLLSWRKPGSCLVRQSW